MKIIDLTHDLHERVPVYPGTGQPIFHKIDVDGYRELKMEMYTHTGTHIDAPYHILREGRTLDALPIDTYLGPAIVIDCKALVGNKITTDFLLPFRNAIAGVQFILFNSGWSSKWGTDAYFKDFPTLTTDAAEWLTNFQLKGIGLDSISLDEVHSKELPNHHIVLAKDMVIVENLTNLDSLPQQGAVFQCFPLKIVQADGSPVRAVALLN